MSTEEIASSYVDVTAVKDFLKITDSIDDDTLDGLVSDANDEISMRLIPFADSLPIEKKFYNHASKAGFFYVVSCWKEKINNKDAAKDFMEKFEKKMEVLIDALKAEPTGRTKRHSVKTTFKTKPLFAQTKK